MSAMKTRFSLQLILGTLFLLALYTNITFANGIDVEKLKELGETELLLDDKMEKHLKLLSQNEKEEQIRDWIAISVLLKYKIDLTEIKTQGADSLISIQSLYDLFPLRSEFLGNGTNYRYGPTRSFSIGSGKGYAILAIIPADTSSFQINIASIADEYRMLTNIKPNKIVVICYEIADKYTFKFHSTVDSTTVYHKQMGYVEEKIRDRDGLIRFLGQIDDLTFAQSDGISITLGGRRIKNYRRLGITLEEVATLYQAYSQGNDSVGFSLDPKLNKKTFTQEIQRLKQGSSDNNEYFKKLIIDPTYKKTDVFKLASASAKYSVLLDEAIDTYLNDQDDGPYFQLMAYLEGKAYNNPAFKDQMLKDAKEIINERNIPDPKQHEEDECECDDKEKEAKSELEEVLEKYRYFEPPSNLKLTDEELWEKLLKEECNKTKEMKSLKEFLFQLHTKCSFQQPRYIGDIQGTSIGMNLYYTDLLMKIWRYNYKGSRPNFIFPKALEAVKPIHQEDLKERPIYRLWLLPRDEGFELEDKSFYFASIATKINGTSWAQWMSKATLQEGAPTYKLQSFLDFWNNHYSDIAKHEPQYFRLNQIMKWSLFMLWLSKESSHSLAFLKNEKVKRDWTFQDWLKSQSELSFRDTLHFVSCVEDNNTTGDCLKLLDEDGQVFYGGVDLPERKTINKKIANSEKRKRVPNNMLRPGVTNSDTTKQANQTIINNSDGVNYTVTKSIAEAKNANKKEFKGSDVILQPTVLKIETSDKNKGEATHLSASVGNHFKNTISFQNQPGAISLMAQLDLLIFQQLKQALEKALRFPNEQEMASALVEDQAISTIVFFNNQNEKSKKYESTNFFAFKYEGIKGWILASQFAKDTFASSFSFKLAAAYNNGRAIAINSYTFAILDEPTFFELTKQYDGFEVELLKKNEGDLKTKATFYDQYNKRFNKAKKGEDKWLISDRGEKVKAQIDNDTIFVPLYVAPQKRATYYEFLRPNNVWAALDFLHDPKFSRNTKLTHFSGDSNQVVSIFNRTFFPKLKHHKRADVLKLHENIAGILVDKRASKMYLHKEQDYVILPGLSMDDKGLFNRFAEHVSTNNELKEAYRKLRDIQEKDLNFFAKVSLSNPKLINSYAYELRDLENIPPNWVLVDVQSDLKTPQFIYKSSDKQVEVGEITSFELPMLSSTDSLKSIKQKTYNYTLAINEALSAFKDKHVLLIEDVNLNLIKYNTLHKDKIQTQPSITKEWKWNHGLSKQLQYLQDDPSVNLAHCAIIQASTENFLKHSYWQSGTVRPKVVDKANFQTFKEQLYAPATKHLLVIINSDEKGVTMNGESITYEQLSAALGAIPSMLESAYIISNNPEELKKEFLNSGKCKRVVSIGYDTDESAGRIESILLELVKEIEKKPQWSKIFDKILEKEIDVFLDSKQKNLKRFNNIISY